MTKALILGATALTLSAGVASAQAVYVTPPGYGYVARPYVAPPGVYVVPPTLPVVSGYGVPPPPDVTPPRQRFCGGADAISTRARRIQQQTR